MASYVIGLLSSVFSHVSSWFTELYVACDAVELFIASISVPLLWRYFLRPVIGSAGSDKVSKRNRKKE